MRYRNFTAIKVLNSTQPLLLLLLCCAPQVGDRVKKGATLGYIEQLGTFVEVKVRCSAASSKSSPMGEAIRLTVSACVHVA
jgi:hypothetical protein